MQHILSLFLILAILLSFTACTTQNAIQTKPTDTANSTTPTVAAGQGWQSLPTFNNLEDYEKYISDGLDMEGFVTYEMVKSFGRFELFVDYGRKKGLSYLYGMVDENGYDLNLHIKPLSETDRTEVTTEKPPHNDLRTSQNRAEFYSVNNILYEYYDGGLYSISWSTNTHSYTIKSGHTVRPYAYTGDKVTLLSRLLNAETAEAAVAEFNAKVAQARQEAQAEKAD